MTATETITTNARVLGADPFDGIQAGGGRKAEKAGGIGEEDLVVLVLPYIKMHGKASKGSEVSSGSTARMK